eukprot:6583276-Pyramimonas_sp.AAC.1
MCIRDRSGNRRCGGSYRERDPNLLARARVRLCVAWPIAPGRRTTAKLLALHRHSGVQPPHLGRSIVRPDIWPR